ncbi:uncharacterized protein LOC125669265 isoform X2 [Ostrea edulis]|uniref:uncharacterized protein LOC125669265 isoform X2 n=1 Tax=Ostrea edulis TaxID=37623 RepID=UPI0024AEBEDE|nr:uncharacterized protein LOC125669265 isoform X2 [Ostrea edulis]
MKDRERIKTFLTKYASHHALSLPARLPNYKSEKILLPSDTTTADMHALYERLAKEMSFRSIHLRTFQRTSHELCPYITIMKPCIDLCQLCQDFSHKFYMVSNMNDEEKKKSCPSTLNMYQGQNNKGTTTDNNAHIKIHYFPYQMNRNRQKIHHAMWTCTCIILGIMHKRSISLIMPSKWVPYF